LQIFWTPDYVVFTVFFLFKNRIGQPYPVLKTNWGLKHVQGCAVKNFELLPKIQERLKFV